MKASGIDVVHTERRLGAGEAASVASALLAEYPNLRALLCANDSMALGAVGAVRQAGRIGMVQVVGFDILSAANNLRRAENYWRQRTNMVISSLCLGLSTLCRF